jgi:hypothetical protein
MPLFSKKQVLNLKLSSISLPLLRELALKLRTDNKGRGSDVVKRILSSDVEEKVIDNFIKEKYSEQIKERRSLISDEDLRQELMKVEDFSWGVVQGQLDQKIQREYVRRFFKYEELINNVKDNLHSDITNYVICTWFNHWTTVLIEEHISLHPSVIPTLKNIKGVDIFFDGQPFDLKTTPLPRDYDPQRAIKSPKDLSIWMYENQGAQRFGADNRLFVVLFDQNEPEKSWELKRDFDLVFQRIDNFFDKETVTNKDEIAFSFDRKSYTAVSKTLIITK